MPASRRDFLAGGSAALFLGLSSRLSYAEINLGDIRLDVVSDGSLTLPAGFIFDTMPKDELAPILSKYNLSSETLEPPCNVTLMRHGDRTVLFDVGSGSDFAPNSGILIDSLEALDVSPDDITDVVFTHAHPDHLWGLLDDFGDPLFSNATFMIGKAEWDYWMDPSTVDTIEQSRTAFAVGAKRRLKLIEDNVTFFNDGEEIMPGVAARATFGHTPGHMALEVRQGSEAVMILGDCIGNNHVAFEKPQWHSGSDQDQELGSKTRAMLLDQLAAEKTRIIGYHLPGNGTGFVEKSGSGFTFVPEEK